MTQDQRAAFEAQIELPPLPEWSKMDNLANLVPSEIRQCIAEYARQAVAEAIARDRQQQYRSVYEEGWKDALEWRGRQQRGEPVAAEIMRRVYKDSDEHKQYLTARFGKGSSGVAGESFEWDGHRWAYRYTSFDDAGEYDLLYRPAPQPAEPAKGTGGKAPFDATKGAPTRPTADEAHSALNWIYDHPNSDSYTEFTVLRNFINMWPAEPVNVPNGYLRTLGRLLSWAEAQICLHEETHRGGAIWEICDQCGAKWADDEGGRPEFQWPGEITNARALLARYDRPLCSTDMQRAEKRDAESQPAATPPTSIPRDLLGRIVDEVFDSCCEDTTPIEDIYRVIVRTYGQPAASAEPAMRVRVVYRGEENFPDLVIDWTSASLDALPHGTVVDLHAAPVVASAEPLREAVETAIVRFDLLARNRNHGAVNPAVGAAELRSALNAAPVGNLPKHFGVDLTEDDIKMVRDATLEEAASASVLIRAWAGGDPGLADIQKVILALKTQPRPIISRRTAN